MNGKENLVPMWPCHAKVFLEPKKTGLVPNFSNSTIQLHALLVNGENLRHARDLYQIIECFKFMDVPIKNITSLDFYSNHAHAFSEFDKNVNRVLDRLETNDKFLFVFTGHGDIRNGKAILKLRDNWVLTEDDLSQALSGFKNPEKVAYFAQCFSGAFAYRAAEDGFIGIANAKRDQESWGTLSIGAHFTRYLFPFLIAPNVTVESAFDVAIKTKSIISLNEVPLLVWSTTHPGYVTLNKR